MTKTFSESWYRVANQRICLRPVVRVRRQNFRGERWIVLENPFSNQYFRLRPGRLMNSWRGCGPTGPWRRSGSSVWPVFPMTRRARSR